MQTRQDKIRMLQDLQDGKQRNGKLKALCREVLPWIDDKIKIELSKLMADPFATQTQLYEMASGGLLSKIVDIINFDRRPRWKDEIINGVDTCSAIYYNDEEEEPWDEKKIEKEIEMLDKLNKFKP